jgi:hypothetical protein
MITTLIQNWKHLSSMLFSYPITLTKGRKVWQERKFRAFLILCIK